jgi:hypothetical protein
MYKKQNRKPPSGAVDRDIWMRHSIATKVGGSFIFIRRFFCSADRRLQSTYKQILLTLYLLNKNVFFVLFTG